MATDVCFFNHSSCLLLSEHLRFISDHCVKDWRRILRALGISDHIIEAVTEDAIGLNYYHDSREIAYQGFLKWQQSNPNKASLCMLSTALDDVSRNDVKDKLQIEFGLSFPGDIHRPLGKSSSFPQTVEHFVARECELRKILQFCQCHSSLKLLLLIGLPGIGKTELLNSSLSNISCTQPKLHVVRPLFPSNDHETRWGLEDVAVCILEELQPHLCLTKHRVAVLHKTLTSITEPTLLILEIANLNFKPDALIAFWSFMDRLLRFENQKLKVIATSCKNPDLNQLQHMKVDELVLKELGADDATKLLQSMNPKIKKEDCIQIYKFCGGNPFILRKFGAHIQNFTSLDEELKAMLHTLELNTDNDLHPFIRKTALKRDMKIVFNDLERDEQETLVKLCCLREIIPIDMMHVLFGADVVSIANHLWHSHCILNRDPCATFYRMNEITRAFIIDYAQSNEQFKNVLLDAKIALIQHHLTFLRHLDDLFFNPFGSVHSDILTKAIKKYRLDCKICRHGNCVCVLPHIIQIIFQNTKTTIMQSIKSGLQIELLFIETVDTCLHTVHFLRNVLSTHDLNELYDLVFEKLNFRGDKVRMAITIANLVFIKIYHRVCQEKDQNISYLSKSIDFLEKNRLLISVEALITLAFCYVNRGYLRGFYKGQFKQGKKDIDKARKLLQYMPKIAKVPVAELSTYGYMGAIYYRNKMLNDSIKERAVQIEGYKKMLGTHPYTAKSLHYQAQGYAKLRNYSQAVTCCVLSYQMYLRLKGKGLETMRVLSTHGKMLVCKGSYAIGIKKLEHALVAAENVLGEHDKVAACYDQLADANTKLLGTETVVEKLRRKSSAMREQFDLNTTLYACRKTYSLQLSIDDSSKFNFMDTDENDNYFRFAFLMMLLTFLWHAYCKIFVQSCSDK